MAKIKMASLEAAERQFNQKNYSFALSALRNAVADTHAEEAVNLHCEGMLLYPANGGDTFFNMVKVDKLRSVLESIRRQAGGTTFLHPEVLPDLDDLGIKPCVKAEDANIPEITHPVQGLEACLIEPRASSINKLPELAARLEDVTDWLQYYEEPELDEIAKKTLWLAKHARNGALIRQHELFTEAQQLLNKEIMPLYNQLQGIDANSPDSILQKGQAKSSSKEEIFAAAKILDESGKNRTILKRIETYFSMGDTPAARIMARRDLNTQK